MTGKVLRQRPRLRKHAMPSPPTGTKALALKCTHNNAIKPINATKIEGQGEATTNFHAVEKPPFRRTHHSGCTEPSASFPTTEHRTEQLLTLDAPAGPRWKPPSPALTGRCSDRPSSLCFMFNLAGQPNFFSCGPSGTLDCVKTERAWRP